MNKQRVIFMGTPDFAVPCLEALTASEDYEVVMVITQPDRPKGRGLQKIASPVKIAALKLNLEPILQPERIRKSEELATLLECPADFLVTVAYGQLLPQICLDHPKFAPINVHASLLPTYRGSAPLHRVILNGETKTGITTMKMVRALDAGDILLQESLTIDPDETVGTLHDRLCQLGSDLLVRTLAAYNDGSIHPIPQDEAKVSFAPPIIDSDQRVQWKNSAQTIKNQIRGLNPWPVAYAMYQNQVWKLWQAKVSSTNASKGSVGEILELNAEGILVQCGEGQLLLTEIQPAGKKRMHTEAYLRGNPVQVGEFLC
jgi:methionyl-tRNA formyltransferase